MKKKNWERERLIKKIVEATMKAWTRTRQGLIGRVAKNNTPVRI